MTAKTRRTAVVLLPALLCFFSMAALFFFWLEQYRSAEFDHISRFCRIMAEEYPDTEPLMLSALKEYSAYPEKAGSDFLAKYGYQSGSFGKGFQKTGVYFGTAAFLVTAGGFLCAVWYLGRQNRKRLLELTEYLEQVNVGAAGTVLQTKEDEFAHLQDEIYKTVTSLYQTREAAVLAKENFAENLANIAHQLKTPVTAASLSLQLMKEEAPGRCVEQMERQLGRLERLEEALLTLSQIDTGTLRLECVPVDIYTALLLAAENLDHLFREKGIRAEIPDKGCIEICGDLEWTMEALMNLMKNCLEHSPEGGAVHCDYSKNPLYAEILIWDEGRGFAPKEFPRLFERFYRGRGAASDGLGIGLSLARAVFEMQHGRLTARNLPGGGACFEIRIYENTGLCH